MSSGVRLKLLLENECTVLCCTPTYALHLAEVAAREGLELHGSHVRVIVVAGEPGGSLPATRARLSEAWNGARVFDHHGMTEVGPVTHEHPEQPGSLVVMDRSHFAEVVDPGTGAPVAEGEVGELVLTTLRRVGSPLIRYRTGDLVRLRRFSPPLTSHLSPPTAVTGTRRARTSWSRCSNCRATATGASTSNASSAIAVRVSWVTRYSVTSANSRTSWSSAWWREAPA